MPMRRERYAADWEAISRRVRERAGWRCEGTPRFPECRVVLTVAHLDHDTTNNDAGNLRALCQRCHLDWDHDHHVANARRTRWAQKLGGQTARLFAEVE